SLSELTRHLNAQMEIVTVAEKPKKIHRFQIGLNVVVQIGLLIFLALMVNYFGFEHYRTWVFSRDQKYTLPDKTERMLDSLKGKLRITVFFSPNTPITNDVQSLLTNNSTPPKGKSTSSISTQNAAFRGRRNFSTNTR